MGNIGVKLGWIVTVYCVTGAVKATSPTPIPYSPQSDKGGRDARMCDGIWVRDIHMLSLESALKVSDQKASSHKVSKIDNAKFGSCSL